MPPTTDIPDSLQVFKRQTLVCVAFGLLLATVVGGLSLQSRRREWMLRREQAKHRLDVAFELISREVDRVRSDALFLADQEAVKRFAAGDVSLRDNLKAEYVTFVKRKGIYDQIRLLDLAGQETIRVNYSTDQATLVEGADLQDKSDRYYFQEALTLERDEIFVSDFDLNLEHGQIEKPLKPVIRFVAPVVNEAGQLSGLLVLNYLGAALLQELDDVTLPGFTMLLRPDSHYLRSPQAADSWGWLLGHDRTFARQFPVEWARMTELSDCRLTPKGAFAIRQIPLGRSALPAATVARPESVDQAVATVRTARQDSILVVSYLPRREVFADSNALLQRLLMFAGGVFVLAVVFAREWARATLTRQSQARRIASSEEQLRELSSRLLRIQEDERRAISREIHDDFGQQVTAINLDLKLAQRHVDSAEAAKRHLSRAIQENESLLRSMHDFAKRVRPAVLDDLGLKDAIESHLSEFRERTGVDIQADLQFCSQDIPDTIADNLYRLLQESLNNVAKHADASHVSITMAFDSPDKNALVMSVRDNGRGHKGSGNSGTSSSSGRLGIVGMRERVELLSGDLRMETDGSQGTTIRIYVPVRSPGNPRVEQQRGSGQ